jgi:hypothetical protein
VPLLFSYGTLQQEAVQLSTFGRVLSGRPDELPGFEPAAIEITDPKFLAGGGAPRQTIVRFTGRSEHRVSGTAFEVTDSELESADAYEPVGYRRVAATLASGRQAWVYAAG